MRPVQINNDMPSDAEVEEVTRYTMGVMSDAEETRFEARMAADPALFYRMAPLLKALNEAPAHAEEIQAGIDAAEAEAEVERLAEQTRNIQIKARRHTATAIGTALAIKPLLAWAGLAAAASIVYVLAPRPEQSGFAPPAVVAKAPDSVPTTTPKAKPPTEKVVPPVVRPRQEVAELPVVLLIDPAAERMADSIMRRPLAPLRSTPAATEIAAAHAPEVHEWPPESAEMIKAFHDFMAVPRANGESWWERLKGKLTGKPTLPGTKRPPGGFER